MRRKNIISSRDTIARQPEEMMLFNHHPKLTLAALSGSSSSKQR